MAKAAKVLELLELLQDRPGQTGQQLAAALDVDVRTVRRYAATLGELGIPVEGERGPGGGYRLRPGYRTPPLMLTDEETAAVVLGLLAARRDGLDADGALTKVRRVLPDRIRRKVEALEQTTSFTTSPHRSPAPPSSQTLLDLGAATRAGRRIGARYTTHDGVTSTRELSPFGLVAHAGRWYLAAHDHARGEPRTLRVDRLRDLRAQRAAAEPAPPDFEAVAFVSRALARVPWTHEVEVTLHATVAQAREHFPPTLAELHATSRNRTRLRLRAESLDWVAAILAGSGLRFTVRRPDELRAAVHALAQRLGEV